MDPAARLHALHHVAKEILFIASWKVHKNPYGKQDTKLLSRLALNTNFLPNPICKAAVGNPGDLGPDPVIFGSRSENSGSEFPVPSGDFLPETSGLTAGQKS